MALTAVETTPRSFSFPSTHAANGFAAAIALGSALPRYRNALLTGAGLTSFSRVWLGVHHPSDVIGGAALGVLVGWVTAPLGEGPGLDHTPGERQGGASRLLSGESSVPGRGLVC